MATVSPRRVKMLAVACATACAVVLAGCELALTRPDGAADSAGAAELSAASEASTVAELLQTLPAGPPGLVHLIALDGPANDDGTLGSGCDIEEDAPLPDGTYYAFVLDLTPTHLRFDIACMFGQDSDQWRTYRDLANDDEPWSNHVVMNDVVIEHEAPLSRTGTLHVQSQGWAAIPLREAAGGGKTALAGAPVGVWVAIRDGQVVAAVEPALDPPTASEG